MRRAAKARCLLLAGLCGAVCGASGPAVVFLLLAWQDREAAIRRPGFFAAAGLLAALAGLLNQPFGRVLLAVTALGLLAYAAWRLADGLLDIDGEGHGARGLVVRGAQLFSAFVHLGLAGYAGSLALGMPGLAAMAAARACACVGAMGGGSGDRPSLGPQGPESLLIRSVPPRRGDAPSPGRSGLASQAAAGRS